ncbi:amidohydrolase family protein [Bordetella genomosp. 9]|uniref:Amidohydrolase-related domain-containing protein n=1 Tax=Bordetella genomosp. 9 TaxID=1416803 RepID=A0A1W6YVZ4_9BORD|nr:amidohydrolase family protein [Bordetella genomosp. 9]ARP85272.1 hypothetical protein CAL13_02855 [Bordetella genomosp. 9]
MPPRIPLAVDTHAHVFLRGLPMQDRRRYTPDHDATLDDYLGHLDRHGLTHGVLVQPSFLGTDNRFLLQALAQARGRLRGVVVIEPGISPEELRRLHQAGVRGIRLNLFGLPTPELAGAEWQSLLTALRALDWHVEVHAPAGRLRESLDVLIPSGCRVVVDHFGRPDGVEDAGFHYLLQQASSGRIWVKLSAAYRIWPQDGRDAQARQAATRLLAAYGPERLLWGSDWPHTENQYHADYASAWRGLAAWVEDDRARRIILADTPSALFGIEETSHD